VNTGDGVVLVRSSAQPDVELPLTAEQWRSLVDAVKADAFMPGQWSGPDDEPPSG
jgi:hypothetical protein